MKQKLADAETENESLANRLDKQVTEFKQKELARLEQRYKENQAHITSSKEAVINDLNSQLDNLRVKYESSQNLYDNLASKHERYAKNMESEKERLINLQTEYKVKHEQCLKDLEYQVFKDKELTDEIEMLKGKFNNLNDTHQKLSMQVEDIKCERDEAEANANYFSSENVNLQQSYNYLESQKQQLETELNINKSLLQDQNQKIAKLKSEFSNLKDKYNVVQAESSSRFNENSKIIQRLEDRESILCTQIQEFQEQNDQNSMVINELHNEIDLAKEEIDSNLKTIENKTHKTHGVS